MKNKKLNMHTIRRILLGLFCILIGTGIAVVLLQFYNPSQNNIGALSSVSMDIVCIIILLVMLVSFVFHSYGAERTTKLYAALLTATVLAMFLDFLNWVFDGSLEFGQVTFWFTLGSLCMGAVLAMFFSVYLCSYMAEKHKIKNMRLTAKICAGVNLLSFCVTLVLALSGTAFQFVDGHYEVGVLYDVVAVIPILTLLYLTGVIISKAKKIGTHDVLAVVGYIIFMIIGALIEATISVGTTYVAVAIADIFIFVTLQNEVIALEKQQIKVWMERSNTDELTGLYNRHAYEEDVAKLDKSKIDDNFVYVSMDVNLLKRVNDNLGHKAGDELLLGATTCIKKCMGQYGKLYRIGGDEFIALLYMTEEQLEVLKRDIARITDAWKGKQVKNLAVSCGYVTRRENEKMSVKKMAVLADKRMYEAKQEYYIRMGLDRRKG